MAVRADVAVTGHAKVDAILAALAISAVTWLGAAAPRWLAAVLVAIAAATSWHPLGVALGIATAVIGSALPVPRDYRRVATATMVGIALNIAARSQLEGVLGLSLVVFVALATVIGIVGGYRRSRSVRRRALAVGGALVMLAVLGAVSLGVAGVLAAGDIRTADTHARAALDALGDGDIDRARDAFANAATSFERADDRLDHPATAIARLVPGVAQHRRVANDLARGGAEASRALVGHLGEIDLDALTVGEGRIDVDAVRSLQSSLRAIDGEIARLQQTVASVDSQWLVPPVADVLDRLAGDLDEQRQRGNDALAFALAAPSLLGGDEPRTYFIGFTTPVEARGIGGFMGNWAEITVTDGRFEVTDFGRSDDLDDAGDPATRRFTTSDAGGDLGLDEWLTRYGNYNLTSGPGGTTGPAVWKNMNMSPDMATTGRAIAELYPQSGGGELDGVFFMDVFALTRLLQFTGPVELPDGQVVNGQRRLTVDTAADFLLHDQYDVDRPERIDLLEEFSLEVIDRLLESRVPPPTDLLDALGPMVDQGRFAGWAARTSEQELFEQIGLSGTLPPLGIDVDSDALAVVFNNVVGNKIDYYLYASASYTVTADATTSTTSGDVVIALTNRAPSAGEPDYVIGNRIGLPTGSNRTWVSIYTRLPVVEARIGQKPAAIERGVEAGYYVTSVFVTLGPGESTTLTASTSGRLDVGDGYHLALRTPPAVRPMPVRVDATWIDGGGNVHRVRERRPDPGLALITVDGGR